MSNDKSYTLTNQERSEGGKARAKKLSSIERSAIARHASHSRKSVKDIIKSTHDGSIKIGDIEIKCAVLDDGRRVITQTSMNKSLGRKGKNSSTIKCEGSLQLPNFLLADNLSEFIDEDLIKLSQPLIFYSKIYGKAYGFDASLLPKVCNVYLNARRSGKIRQNQEKIVIQCEILMSALAQVGITALIDESTGYEKVKEKNELQELFAKFIAEELQPWVKRFPDSFFNHLKRIYGLQKMKKTPMFFGHLINRWVYKELSPEIHEELKRLNPIDPEIKRRKHSHHQLLTHDIGCPALEKQIQKVTTLMSISETKEEFEKFLEKSKTEKEI